MKKKLLLFLFLLSPLIAFAQKTTLTYQVVVYVEQKTADYFGGKLAMQDSVKAQLAKVNAYMNAQSGLNNFYNFNAYSFKFYNDNANDDSTVYYHRMQAAEPNNRYRIVYDAFPDKVVNGNYVHDYNIVFEIGWQSVLFSYNEIFSRNGSMFGRVMNNTICHEFMHARGAWDLYAGDVDASGNSIKNNMGFKNPIPSLMNNLFADQNLDKHSVYMINRTAALYGASTFDDGQRGQITANAFPSTFTIKVLNSSGGAQANASVKLYGVEWYQKVVTATPLEYTTNASGNVTFSGANNPFNDGGWPKYNSIFVTVTSGSTVKYAWISYYDLSIAFVDGLSSYTKTISLGSANTAPLVSIGNSGSLVDYGTSDFSIPVNAYDYDPNGSIANVKLYDNGSYFADAVFDGTDIYWMAHYPLSLGKHLFTAVATDNNGASATSSTLQVDVWPLNQIKTAVTAPLTGSTYNTPASIVLNAYAYEGRGGISKVEYYRGTTLIGSSTTKPYAVTWNNPAAGTYSITAKAYDTQATPLTKTSAAISVTVNTVLSPVVSITSPANNAVFTAPVSITIAANASETGGSISKVEFYRGTTLLGTDNTSPYSYTWNNPAVGSYALTAKAYDAQTVPATKVSAVVNITVNPLTPVVSITSPANNATFAANSTVTITANASETGGSISKVEFYRGTTLLGTDNTSPYSYTWTNVPAGTYSLTAKAYDAQTTPATKTSTAVTITVGSTCSAQQWNSTTAYSGGAVVQYNGIKYLANWWNQNRRPDLYNGPAGSGMEWLSQGTCNSREEAVAFVEEVEGMTGFTAYPNPANGEVTFRLGNAQGEASLTLFTAQGQKAATVFSGTLSSQEISFDTRGLAKGLYVVLFTNQQETKSMTLVVE